MPAINLPNNESAILKTRGELSERAVRAISRSYMVAGSTVAKMASQGFDETEPSTWGVWQTMSDEEVENVNVYQSVLIVNMVSSWSLGELPTMENVQDLPSGLFQALATACSDEFTKVADFSPDGALDPKVPTENSTDSVVN